jgi:isopentenyl-diphosphate delta-isomerase
MIEPQVILVNEADKPVGTIEKMEAHRKGLLHRAFSVFIFNSEGRMLLQQRALKKYHGGGLWSNACCSHPYPGEATEAAASRRLTEELGFKTELKKVFYFTYRAAVENDLIEHEFDHVFVGIYNGPVEVNDEEVAAYGYETIPAIKEALVQTPANFTAWFRLIFPRMEAWWQEEFVAKENKAVSV